MTIEKSVSLRCTKGTSNKVYHMQLLNTSSGWAVMAEYGKYGKDFDDLRVEYKLRPISNKYAAEATYHSILRQKTDEKKQYYRIETLRPTDEFLIMRAFEFSAFGGNGDD